MIGGVADAFTLEIVIMQWIVMEDGGGGIVEMAFASIGDCAEVNAFGAGYVLCTNLTPGDLHSVSQVTYIQLYARCEYVRARVSCI